MAYKPPGTPDPGPGWYGSPQIGWSDISSEDARANYDRLQREGGSGGSSGSGQPDDEHFIQEALKGPFAGIVSVFANNPEIRPLIAEMARSGRDAAWFEAQLRQTRWWSERSSLTAAWEALSHGEREQRIASRAGAILNYYQQLGGADWLAQNPQFQQWLNNIQSIEGNELRYVSYLIESGQMPWEVFQYRTYANFAKDPTTALFVSEQQRREELARLRKRPQEIAEELWQQARGEFFVRISKDSATEWADNIINGRSSYGEWNDFLRRTAQQFYPAFSQAIENGVKPGALFAPMLDLAADEYGTSREAVIANDKLWGQILNSASGNQQMPTAADWLKYLRSQPEWETTLKGRRAGNELAAAFGRVFGRAV